MTRPPSPPSLPYALSPTQQGLLFHALLAPGAPLYFEQRWCRIDGPLDAARFRAAWQQVLDAHEALRSRFNWPEGGTPEQQPVDGLALPWAELDWSGAPDNAETQGQPDDQTFQAWLAADRDRGFVLTEAPLMRCSLIRLGPQRHRFVWSYHHLLMDGWSNALVIAEVLARYADPQQARPAPRAYREHVAWLARQDRPAAQAHWRAALAGVDAPTPLPWLRAAPDSQSGAHDSGEATLVLDVATTAALQAAARGARLTLNTVLQGAWALLLARATGQARVLFGATVAGRPAALAEAERRVGLYIHTVPMPVAVPPAAAPGPWLAALQQAMRAHEAQAHLGLAEIQRESAVPGGTPLFDSVLVFENYPLSSAAALAGVQGGLQLAEIGGHERTHYPLALMVLPGDRITLQLRHDAARLGAASAARLLRQLAALLAGLARALAAPATLIRLDALSPIDADEAAQIARAAHGPAPTPASAWPPFPQRFAQQVARQPQALALRLLDAVDGVLQQAPETLSYAELDARARRLAARLQAAGVRHGQRVGVCLPRGAGLVVALLAVWQAGAAYVPLDPLHPAARRALVARRAGLALRITTAALADERLDELAAEGEALPTIPWLDPQDDPASAALAEPVALGAADTAYLMFTSGSTGTPKGVAVSHGALANLLAGMARAPGLAAGEGLLALTTVAFDIAGLELWGPLAVGGWVALGTAALAREPDALTQALAPGVGGPGVQVLQATPATWQMLRDAGWPGAAHVRAWVGGEALDAGLAAWLLPRCAALWNLYGPTETTIWSTALRVTPAVLGPAGAAVPVGGPTQATHLAVLDAWGGPAGIGIPGELLIGGAGVAEGYVGQPALTAASFVPDPPSEDHAGPLQPQGARRYRTGDLVAWREDGGLDFLGRADHQVKLRGHRIELGEIEAVLARQPGVRQAVVLLRADLPAGPELVAYLRLDASSDGDAQALNDPATLADVQRAAAACLPGYMLPAHWLSLAAWPLTPNGKIDRRALPAPQAEAHVDGVADAAEQDPLLALVAGVWAQVLGRQPGPQDQFFALGGHSIAAARMATRLQALRPQAGAVPLRLLFEHPRLADYVQALRQQAGTPAWPPVQRLVDDVARPGDADAPQPVPLLAAQQRQWLIAQFAPDSRAYTIGLQIQIDGALDRAALAQALQALVDRHEALRTGFEPQAGRPLARVWPRATLALERLDEGAEPGPASAAWLARPFDLRQPPLARAALAGSECEDGGEGGEGPQRLLLALHHLVADDASIGVLARELAADYAALSHLTTGVRSVLHPEPALRCRDVAAWQQGLDLSAARRHWQAALQDVPPPQPLHIEQVVAAVGGASPAAASVGQHRQALPAMLVRQVQAAAQAQGATPYMFLLAAYALLLQRHGAGDDLVIGSPVAGRPRTGQPQLEGLVGMFVNTLPLRLRLQGRLSGAQCLAQVRAVALAAWEHQDLPLEQMLAALPPARAAAPLFDTVFSLQNAHGSLPPAQAGGLRWRPLPLQPLAPKFGLSLALRPALPDEVGVKVEGAEEAAPALWAQWEFDPQRFSPRSVQRLAARWLHLLQQLIQQPDLPAALLALPTPDEAAQLAAWSRPQPSGAPPQGSLWAAFAQQAQRHAGRTALVDEGRDEGDGVPDGMGKATRRWTYAQLQAEAEALAGRLHTLGLRPGGLAALWGARSGQAVVALLAVLRCGAAYVPLDPQAPAERLAQIVVQSQRLPGGLHLLCSAQPAAPALAALQQALADLGAQPLQVVDTASPVNGAPPPPEDQLWPNATPQVQAEALAYVMHTSGSTGGPKPVGTPQRGVLRLVQQVDYVQLGPDQVLLQAAPLAFDAATFEIWGALLHGAQLVIARDTSLPALAGLLQRHGVRTLWLTAALMQAMVDEQLPAFAGVQQLLAGGDVLSPPHVARLLAAHPQLRLVNGYGPTETTTFACCHTVTAADAARGRIPIGRPIAHTRVAVVDAQGQLQPPGLPGELLIGGAGVARGYLGRPALSAAAFVPDPEAGWEEVEAGEAGQVLYRSGDRVRWRDEDTEGVLEFLGRVDRQFKLRGQRLEPAEIEARLLAHEGVADAVLQLLPSPAGPADAVAGQPRLAA